MYSIPGVTLRHHPALSYVWQPTLAVSAIVLECSWYDSLCPCWKNGRCWQAAGLLYRTAHICGSGPAFLVLKPCIYTKHNYHWTFHNCRNIHNYLQQSENCARLHFRFLHNIEILADTTFCCWFPTFNYFKSLTNLMPPHKTHTGLEVLASVLRLDQSCFLNKPCIFLFCIL